MAKQKTDMPEQEQAQEQDYRSLDLDDAVELMLQGHVMSCIDNGNGFMLPGFVKLVNPDDITEALLKHTINPKAKIISQENIFVNIVPMQNNECSVRFFKYKDFACDSVWFDETQHMDEITKQAIQVHMPANAKGS